MSDRPIDFINKIVQLISEIKEPLCPNGEEEFDLMKEVETLKEKMIKRAQKIDSLDQEIEQAKRIKNK